MSLSYGDFLATKRPAPPLSGIEYAASEVDPRLFEFQRHVVAWAVRRGRAAVWLDTGLGKTRIQLAWLRRVLASRDRPGFGLILAPLAVADQTIREAAAIDIRIRYVRDQTHLLSAAAADPWPYMFVSNYERLHLFNPAAFTAVVLDESSILKAFSGVTKRALVAAFRDTPYRLACTATPAPNDIEELCNHADFLGVMSPQEMRSTFFIADSRGEFMRYRLKGHARAAFFRWLASWAIACRDPGDLGFTEDAARFRLPELQVVDHVVPTDWSREGELFTAQLAGVTERAQVRRETLAARAGAALDVIDAQRGEQWLAWCGLNAEQDMLAAKLGDDCVSIDGRTPLDDRVLLERDWRDGRARVLVTKPAVFGWGMNWQHCARMVFAGPDDSFEQWYQAVRRCWRFGQRRAVEAHVVLADVQRPIIENLRAKETATRDMTGGLVSAVATENRSDLYAGTSKGDDYEPRRPLTVPDWLRSL